MTTTYKGTVITDALKAHVEANKEAVRVKRVFYGDQDKLPTTPVLCIEPAVVMREITHTGQGPIAPGPGMTNRILVVMWLYHTSLKGVEHVQREADQIAEGVVDLINLHCHTTKLNGLITSGHVSRVEHGYKVLQNKINRATRLSWEGLSRTTLLEV